MVPTTKEAQRTELHKTIWRIANDLRGSVDGWDFKAYVLGMLFYRGPRSSDQPSRPRAFPVAVRPLVRCWNLEQAPRRVLRNPLWGRRQGANR